MDINDMNRELLNCLGKFNPHKGLPSLQQIDLDLKHAPAVVDRIVAELKNEKGLTYVGAYAVLEIVFNKLQYESNFLQLEEK